MTLGTVTGTAPLKVRLDGAATPSDARVMARGDVFAPAVNARVVTALIAGRLYILGSA